jgi:hypothetical protein
VVRITLEVTVAEDPDNAFDLNHRQVVEDLKARLEVMRRIPGVTLDGEPAGGFTVTNVREV